MKKIYLLHLTFSGVNIFKPRKLVDIEDLHNCYPWNPRIKNYKLHEYDYYIMIGCYEGWFEGHWGFQGKF